MLRSFFIRERLVEVQENESSQISVFFHDALVHRLLIFILFYERFLWIYLVMQDNGEVTGVEVTCSLLSLM